MKKSGEIHWGHHAAGAERAYDILPVRPSARLFSGLLCIGFLRGQGPRFDTDPFGGYHTRLVQPPVRLILTSGCAMKLAAITDEISQDFEHALDVMLEYGVRYAELRGLWGTNIADLDRDQVRRARRALADRDMRAICLASPAYKCELETDEAAVAGRMHLAKARSFSEQLELLRRCADLAHAFDTSLVRVFSFWKRGPLTNEIEERIVQALSEAAETAGECQILLGLENEHACYLGTGAEIARVLDAVGSPHMRGVWDPGNALCAGEKPVPDGYQHVRGRIEHIHVKDGIREQDGLVRWVVIGEGEVDYPLQFQLLSDDGYDGYISLETHYIPANGTPEDGSRPCLAALRQMLED